MDGWKPPESPDAVDTDYWNDLSMDKQKILHYHRNAYQFGRLPQTEAELSEYLWKRIEGDAIAHNIGTSGNRDYRGRGYYEGMQAVYDRYGNLVTTPENMGTYDFEAPSMLNSFYIDHAEVDVNPWIIWGNSPLDKTRKKDRLNALYKSDNGRLALYVLGYINKKEILSPIPNKSF